MLSYGDQLEDARTAIQNGNFEKALELIRLLVKKITRRLS
jgi:hypothetical protein